MGHYHDILAELQGPVRTLREAIPETWSGFAQMHKGALSDGALPSRIKELIALALSVAHECDGCIASHARGAARRGATPEEVAEALGVAVLMLGGPGTVYGPRAWEAYQEFAGAG